MAGVVCFCAQRVLGDVVTIQAEKDNTLYENLSGSVSNGSGPNFFIGKNASGIIRRGLFAFNAVSRIPPGSKINGVLLTLHMSRTTSGSQTVSLHRLVNDWGEGTSIAPGGGGGGGAVTVGDVSWLHSFYDTDFWTVAGGDFDPVASATADVNEVGFYTWGSTAQMVGDVQGWIDNPASDFGWVLVGNEVPADRTSKRFDARENLTWSFRPSLTIHFTPVLGCTEPLLSDFDGNCLVNFADFAIVASEWLEDRAQTVGGGTIDIEGIGQFAFDPAAIETSRSDIFNEGYFSIFDVLVYLDQQGSINMDYHFDPNMNTHVIDSINSIANWWYAAYYDGGWYEANMFRMDHYPYKPQMTILIEQIDESLLTGIYTSFTNEIIRKQLNGGQVIIPRVTVVDCNGVQTDYNDVNVVAHNLRDDTFKEGTITAIDAIFSLADQGLLTYDLQWYDSIGTAGIVRSYWVQRIDGCLSTGRCGFVYEEGTEAFGWLNHIHIPSDYRVINSPEYERWFWIELGSCSE
jgi:hypothetical protein